METVLSTKGVVFKNKICYADINILRGSVTFICGDSGTGKSSLLKLFNASETPTQGSVFYENNDLIQVDTVNLRREVSLVGQSVYLFDGTIMENFQRYYAYRGISCPDEEYIMNFLHLCCGNFSLSSNCRRLSGGERQRVYLSVFLSFRPKVLMLDEPTSALDQATGIQVIDNICRFCKTQDITLLVVSHDMKLVDRFAEKKIILEKEGILP